jgi:hypothetical protein
VGVVAQVATGADIVRVAEIDGDGNVDVVVRSSAGRVLQWMKGPSTPTTAPIRSIPWQVYTITEFADRIPAAIAIGDTNGDGLREVVASADGGLALFDPRSSAGVFNQWSESLIVDERSTGTGSALGDVSASTIINSILIVDLDGDGANDIVATFDRNEFSGLTNDALVWFRN